MTDSWYEQRLTSANTLFLGEGGSRFTLKHVTGTNYFCGTGRIIQLNKAFYFQDLKNKHISLRILAKNPCESLYLYDLLRRKNYLNLRVKGQICKMMHSCGSGSFGLWIYDLSFDVYEYTRSCLLIAAEFASWSDELEELSANFFTRSLLAPEEGQMINNVQLPDWLISCSFTDKDWLRDTHMLVKCSLFNFELDYISFSIEHVYAISNYEQHVGDMVYGCQFMYSASSSAVIENCTESLFLPKTTEEDADVQNDVPSVKKKRKSISAKLRRQVFERDGFVCCDCGASPQKDKSIELHVDHKVPVALGGLNDIDNLQTLCRDCNLGKSVDVDWKVKHLTAACA